MPQLEDDKESFFAFGRRPGRFYVSSRFPEGGSDESEDESSSAPRRNCRFAYQVIDETGEILFSSDGGWEVALRETPSRQQLKALFFEDTRRVRFLTFQRFNRRGKRLDKESFTLKGDEIAELKNFLGLISSQSFDLADGADGMHLLPAEIETLLSDESTQLHLLRRYRPAIHALYEADVEAPEIVALARRRHQLAMFQELLSDEDAFTRRRAVLRAASRRNGPEHVWQDFFETNHWIFGTGLAPQFLHAWNEDRLEQAVTGSSIFEKGKRPDAVMRTAGVLSALAFVEIKAHSTPLLNRDPYRPGAWRISDEVAGGIAQCQVTVDQVARRAEHTLGVVDDEGFNTGEFALVCRPRSLLVVGSLGQFLHGDRVHIPMYESFERFRRSIHDPQIITFDELLERAAMSLALTSPEEPSPNDEASGRH